MITTNKDDLVQCCETSQVQITAATNAENAPIHYLNTGLKFVSNRK